MTYDEHTECDVDYQAVFESLGELVENNKPRQMEKYGVFICIGCYESHLCPNSIIHVKNCVWKKAKTLCGDK